MAICVGTTARYLETPLCGFADTKDVGTRQPLCGKFQVVTDGNLRAIDLVNVEATTTCNILES